MFVRRILPDHHLSADSKEVVRLATALIATLAALVLGLLIASTRSSYDQTSGQITRMIADVVVLDRLLDQYGPETTPLRQALRDSITPTVNAIWRGNDQVAGPFHANAQGEAGFY